MKLSRRNLGADGVTTILAGQAGKLSQAQDDEGGYGPSDKFVFTLETVDFNSDGPTLPPQEYADLLAQLATQDQYLADGYGESGAIENPERHANGAVKISL